ncbi:MAG: hypothetical protein ACHQVS_05195 [Candidatus Babeliales bacterium]
MTKSAIKFSRDKKGNKARVVMPIKQFEKLMDELEELKDLADVYEIKSKNFKSIPYEKVRKKIFSK